MTFLLLEKRLKENLEIMKTPDSSFKYLYILKLDPITMGFSFIIYKI